jgi:hypothetical protein
MEENTTTINETGRRKGRPKGYIKCPNCRAWIYKDNPHTCTETESTPQETI